MNPVLRFAGLLLTVPFAGFAGQTENKTQEERQTPTTLHPEVTLEPQLGETTTLPCQLPNNANIKAVNWTKTGTVSQNVIFYRDGQLDTDNQDQSFENRVQLHSEPKAGNLSLVLKSVSSSDYGRYECSFKESKGGDIITSPPICIVILKEPGWLVLVICAVVVVGVGGGVFVYAIFKMRKRRAEKNSDTAGKQNQISDRD